MAEKQKSTTTGEKVVNKQPMFTLAGEPTNAWFSLIKWEANTEGKALRLAMIAQCPAAKDDNWIFLNQRGDLAEAFKTEMALLPSGKWIRVRNLMAAVLVDTTQAPVKYGDRRDALSELEPKLADAKVQFIPHNGAYEVRDLPKP